ncbi:unnamed protein product, partial [Meganyctiphanes norvegica]
GFAQVGHYVVYNTTRNNTDEAIMIYCDEQDDMQSVDKEYGAVERSGARNCKELQDLGMSEDGPNIIYPLPNHPETPVMVFCDQTTQGGGWTAILRRDDSFEELTDFDRTFEEYAAGFGDVNNDFYIGNEVIHALTDTIQSELWVTIEDIDGVTGYAHYQYFHVAAREEYQLPPYTMSIVLHEGSIGDALGYQNGMGFSAMDQDNDIDIVGECAVRYGGGWWFRSCFLTCLTCPYESEDFHWHFEDSTYTLSKAQMMVRPSTCP